MNSLYGYIAVFVVVVFLGAGADDSSTGGYVSPYHPADTEQVANRLDQLQKLLRADGVKVE